MSGDDASGPDTYCQPVLCDENEYVNDSNQCVACPPGTYNVMEMIQDIHLQHVMLFFVVKITVYRITRV